MASAWLCQDLEQWQRDLYLHLAAGYGIRQANLPTSFRITKSAACYFMQAPDDLCPAKALRWSHVRSLGGDERLARLLVSSTILGAMTEDEVFWESVIRYLILNEPISAEDVVAIVGFIHQQRFQSAEIVCGLGRGTQPLQPEFTLQGRTLMSLRQHMANWRTEPWAIPYVFVPPTPCWEKTAINPFRSSTGDLLWSIDEMLTSKDLLAEAHFMRHCVASYIPACSRRQTSIWSMQVQKGERRSRVLTIEVVPTTRTIRQAKGKRNSPPCRPAMEMLRQWAYREGLKFEGIH